MKKFSKLFIGSGLLIAFIIWTILVVTVDVQEIGPLSSKVGLAALNGPFSDLTPFNETLFKITEPFLWIFVGYGVVGGVIGLVQWIKRKSILKVDRLLWVLGITYITVIIIYIVFNFMKINFRPFLIEGKLEASYPSTHAFYGIFFPFTGIQLVNAYLKDKKKLSIVIKIMIIALSAVVIVGRVVSGVHWLSDIIAGILLGVGFIYLELFFCQLFSNKKEEKNE